MAQPSQINTLRADDFPSGLANKGSMDKLFQILNPFLQQLGQTTTAGTSLGSNIDGQFAQAEIGKGSAWLPMKLTSPFTGNAFTPWPQPSYKIDGTGRLYLRGLFTAASAPATAQIFWSYPKPLYAPAAPTGASGTGRLFSVPFTTDSAARGFMFRLDAGDSEMKWGDGQVAGFGAGGATAWANLSLGANIIGTFSYQIDGNGRVFIRGNIGTSTGGFTSMTVGTLPAGFRPAVTEHFAASVGTIAGATIAGDVSISTAGVVTVTWNGTAIQVSSIGVGGLSFDTGGTPAVTPSSIFYGSLDAISWDTLGGPSLSTRPGFPLNIRLKDGKKPVVVIGWAVNKDTNATEVCAVPGWVANGDGPTGNTLTITSMNDLRDDQAYTLNFFIFF